MSAQWSNTNDDLAGNPQPGQPNGTTHPARGPRAPELEADQALARMIAKFTAENRDQAETYNSMSEAASNVDVLTRRVSDAQDEEQQSFRSHQAVSHQDDFHAPLPRQWLIAGLALAPEWYACYLGAEAFGQGQRATVLLASVMLVVLGGCEFWRDAGTRHRGAGKQVALALLVTVIVALGALRFYFGWIIGEGSLLGAITLGFALTLVTGALVGISCAALRFAESTRSWRSRVTHQTAANQLRRSRAALADARDRLEQAIGRFRRLFETEAIVQATHLDVPEADLTQALDRRLAPLTDKVGS